MKKFNNLSKREIPEVCNSLLENSKVLLKSAELLSQQGNLGVATSLTILGGEELIKAAFLYFHGIGFQFIKIEEFNKVFTSHVPKHQAAQVSELLRFFDAFVNIDESSMEKGGIKTKDKIHRIVLTFLKKVIAFIEPISKMSNNIEWWQNADNLKNRGLYVDYRDELLLPSQVTSSDYEKAVNIITDLSNRFDKIKLFLDLMSKKNLDELVKQVNLMQNMKVD